MSLFIQLAAIAEDSQKVQNELNLPALVETAVKIELVSGEENRSLLFFEDSKTDVASFCSKLSEQLECPVFYLYVYDDFWAYEFFVNGEHKDRFSTMPEYFKELPEEQKRSFSGDSSVLVESWPSLSPDMINKYLVNHEEEGFNGKSKAYETDEYPSWDIWQITDFMKKLGTPYPNEGS